MKLLRLVKILLYALAFCSPILFGALFLESSPKFYVYLNTLLVVLSLIAYYRINRRYRFAFGFLVGVILFYWIALSFRFSDFPYLIPLVIIFIGAIYGVIFSVVLWFSSPIYRGILSFSFAYVHPFGFTWLFPQSFLSYSLFGVDNVSYALVLIATAFFISRTNTYPKKAISLIIFSLAMLGSHLESSSAPRPKLNLVQTHVPQSVKWSAKELDSIIASNLELIDASIKSGKQEVILPETAFPIALNNATSLLEILKQKSRHISIITGALRADSTKEEGTKKEEREIFNSTYIFQNGTVQIIDKMILAPFGEYIPLPDFIKRPLRGILPDEFASAKKFGDYELHGIKFRSAICYEVTESALFEDAPKFIIAMSNNAWFAPSIQGAYQRILMKYYGRKNGTTIYHVSNMSENFIISPALFKDENDPS